MLTRYSNNRLGKLARVALPTIAATALVAVMAIPASAQTTIVQVTTVEPRAPVFELRPYAGAFIPTGAQDDLLANSATFGAQAGLRISPVWSFVGNFGWMPTEDQLNLVGQELDVFQYDLGVYAKANPMDWTDQLSFQPFIGLGAGGRSYDYRDMEDAIDRTFFTGYGAIGGELAYRNLGLRLEARDYVSEFRPLTEPGNTTIRNDVTLSAGLNLRIW